VSAVQDVKQPDNDMLAAEIRASKQNATSARALGDYENERYWLDTIIVLERRQQD
jgi:hypothetical protein